MAYIPQGYGHSIENIGSKAGRVLIGLNTGNYQAIDLSQWIASNPSYLLADHFGKPATGLSINSQSGGPSSRLRMDKGNAKSGNSALRAFDPLVLVPEPVVDQYANDDPRQRGGNADRNGFSDCPYDARVLQFVHVRCRALPEEPASPRPR